MQITKILKKRIAIGVREENALQYVYEEIGDNDKVVKVSYRPMPRRWIWLTTSQFIFSALSSSVTTTGAAVTWLSAFLANHIEWQMKCRAEVDAVLAKHRTRPTQTPNEILATFSLQNWESEFPRLYSCLQENLRITSTGTSFRENASGKDIPIGNAGFVVPNGAYATYLPDNVHMDSRLSENPLEFNPGGRFFNNNNLRSKEPHTFLGWGSGRHLCGTCKSNNFDQKLNLETAGMRIARLEIDLILVHLLANFEFELSNKVGLRNVGSLPAVDRNLLRPEKSRAPIYIRHNSRHLAV